VRVVKSIEEGQGWFRQLQTDKQLENRVQKRGCRKRRQQRRDTIERGGLMQGKRRHPNSTFVWGAFAKKGGVPASRPLGTRQKEGREIFNR